MRLDSLTRLIQSADFMSFRELALECLKLKGYKEITITDGWKDGGTDVRVFELPPNPSRIAFQITVEKNWKSKLRTDSQKVKRQLNLDNMMLMCSRRIPEQEFEAERESIWANHGVQVHRMDCQTIATAFFSASCTGKVLDILGIQGKATRTSFAKSTPRTEAALAFTFFGQDAQSFRELVVESAIVSVASSRESISKEDLIEAVASICQISKSQEGIISSSIDRLIQKRYLSGPAATLRLSGSLKDANETMKRLREIDEAELRNGIVEKLREVNTQVKDEHVDIIMQDLGALMIDSARDAAGSLTLRGSEQESLAEVRQRLQHLHATFDSIGVSEDAVRDQLLEEITNMVTESPLGKHLFAGELFLSMLGTDTPHLIKAFGARTGIQVLLDASVAIPMLCALLYRTVGNRFSVAARHVYDQLMGHGQRFLLPVDYLEEVATHLLRAWYDYVDFIELDTDLARSENSFVSHYVAMRKEGVATKFDEFISSFGLDDDLRKAEFYVARDRLKSRIQRLFDRYEIQITLLGKASYQSIRRAEESIAYAVQKFGRERPTVLQKHDARTVAYLHDRDRGSEEADVLCTWDSVHFWMRENEPAEWIVMNPAVLGDVFAVARTEDYGGRICTPVIFAHLLTDEAAELGARVMDTIARLERGSVHDATLIAEAKRFKEDFVQRGRGAASELIGSEWAKWKGKYCAKPSN